MSPETPLPASSDAEIRAYLRPLLKAGRPPTYKAMRATLGGGFSRLARIKKQVERELAGGDAVEDHVGGQVVASDLVASLEGLFERQWKALEEWERRSLARLEPVTPAERAPSVSRIKGITETSSAQADRLEAVERRLLAMLEKLQGMAKAPASPPSPVPVPVPAAAATLGDVPPAWARQAAAAATSALDGRLQSIEESMRDAAAGARVAFDLAAEVAREVVADASLQLQVARSTLSKTVREEFANPERAAVLDGIRQAVRELRGQVVAGFSTAAAIADRRAVAVRDAIIAMVDIDLAQLELVGFAIEEFRRVRPVRNTRRKQALKGHSRGK